MRSQKHHFSLPPDITYFNHAYMSPMLNEAREAGAAMMARLANPSLIGEEDFFRPAEEIRALLAKLLHVEDPSRFALTPSASYSVANIARQIRPVRGSNMLITSEQFPSNVYSWARLCSENGCELRRISAPAPGTPKRGKIWNDRIIEGIDKKTSLVSLGPLHWTDGTLFDLHAIKEACVQNDALLIVDSSQATCVLPLDIAAIKPDALVSAGYKWLLWPYGTGMAYFGDFFDDGVPMEENWIVHEDSDDFSKLLYYNEEFVKAGMRYSSGEHPAMIHTAMQKATLQRIEGWGIENMYAYISSLNESLRQQLEGCPIWLEEPEYAADHLFGIHFSSHEEAKKILHKLQREGVIVSQRGTALRISIYMYNDENDVDRLAGVIRDSLQ